MGAASDGWGETVEDDPWSAGNGASEFPDARFGSWRADPEAWDEQAEQWDLAAGDPTEVLGRRFAAYVVDLATVVLPILGLVTTVDPPVRLTAALAGVLFLAIHVGMEGRTGRTPGKTLFRVRTVRQSGEVPGLGRALVRSILWVVDSFPWVVPLVGHYTAQRSGGHRRLGDLAARTFVVRREDAGHPLVTVAPEELEELLDGRR